MVLNMYWIPIQAASEFRVVIGMYIQLNKYLIISIFT